MLIYFDRGQVCKWQIIAVISKPNETKQKQKPMLNEMNSKFRNKTLFVCVSG